MHKLLKYMKPFWLSIILIMGLIFVRVHFELALPDYMSDIVTYGIQYSGIEDTNIKAISEDNFNKLKTDEIKSHFTLIEKGNLKYIETYPYLKNSNIYIKNDNKDISNISDKLIIDSLNIKIDEKNTKIVVREVLKKEYNLLGLNLEKFQEKYIFNEGIYMLLITLLSAIFTIMSAYISALTATKIARNLRLDVFKKVETFLANEINKISSSSLITRCTNDIQQLQQTLVLMLRLFLYAPMLGIVAIFKVLRYPDMLWLIGLVLSIAVIVLITTFALTLPKFKKIQKLVDKMNLVVKESLVGIMVIKAFNTQKHEEKRFDNVNTEITKINLFVNRLMSAIMPFMMFLLNLLIILIVWYGGKLININGMQIGEMMAFIQYAIQVVMSFIMISMIFIVIPRASISAYRVFEVLELDVSIKDNKNLKPFKKGKLEFENVSFKYQNSQEYVLKDINFCANENETIAIIGSTGSGKSTLINLLLRFYDVSGGHIKINGIDIKEYSTFDLRENISYVSQKAILFSGDIESNLKFGNENADNKKIQEVLVISQSKNFINDDLSLNVAQGGTNFSGGQKQRLAIARALIKDAFIYIFDDTFSALDFKTESNLKTALNKFIKENKGIAIIIAQKINSIKNSSKIIVLDKGEIVGIGKHEELLKSCVVYKEIALSQVNSEESL